MWLAPSLSSQLLIEGSATTSSQLIDLSPLMELAFREKRIITNNHNNGSEGDITTLAIPLSVGDETLGIVQLAKSNQIGILQREVEFLIRICSQLSLCFAILQGKSHREYLQRNIDHITSIEEINRSILTNLDKESLLNSILSLLHQKFGDVRVNVYIVRWDDKQVFFQFGISEDGIGPAKTYELEQDSGPVAYAIINLDTVIIHRPNFDQRFSMVNLSQNTQSETGNSTDLWRNIYRCD